MEIESTNSGGRAWHDNRWLVLVEFAAVVAIYVARHHHILKVSATPYLLLLAWISLRLRKEEEIDRLHAVSHLGDDSSTRRCLWRRPGAVRPVRQAAASH